jgi:hypothetical protein
MVFKEPAQDSSQRPIAKVLSEQRCDPLDDETSQLQSDPAKTRFRPHKHHGWSDDQTQKEI